MLKLFQLLKPYRKSIAVMLILLFLQSLSQLFLPTLMAAIVDTGIVNEDIAYIIQIGALMLFVTAMIGVFSIWGSLFAAKVTAGFSRDVREKVFTRVENFSLKEFDQLGTSSLITRTTNDVMQVQQVLTMLLRTMITAPMLFIGAFFIALWMNPTLSLVIFAPLPLIIISIFVIAKKAIPLFKSLKEKTDHLNLILREGLTGVGTVRAFNRTEHEGRRFNEANLDFSETATTVNRMIAILTPVMTIILNFTIIALIWIGAFRIEAGSLQVGELMAFIQYAMQIMFSLIMASVMFVAIPRASVSAKRINEILDTDTSVKDPEYPVEAGEHRGEIEFRDISFSYPQAEKSVLSAVSFQVNPGEITAIIGGTGAGKSTLASLLLRFYDIHHGSILLDGIDIRNISQQKLREKIGFVSQQAHLFRGTIADNIRYGNETATKEDLYHAAAVSEARFISQLENGFDTTVSRFGTNLSGGQRQRIAIARALLRNPEVYIFDDSFSALDAKTTATLFSSLRKETGDSSVLMVTQRATIAEQADKIIVLDEGMIAGAGSHEELKETCGVYQEIVSSQDFEEEVS
ncbi:ABC transporter ATP-binding protein [Lentibacillus jeotgali]|uniref:ABC transporter ATP-binding protein n=1 Tax=Lentibacillus jeotgali TaxID=558169 RepID=UPI0002627C08|nr:ABC transporter ATP-binding protein [Lentibacillus jeotgali]